MTEQKQETRTHYRKVFKSDHLGVVDLEELLENGHDLVFNVAYCQQEYSAKVAGKKIDCNVCYFKEDIKPLVINATNSKTMRRLSGDSPFLEDWAGLRIKLYIDQNVKMKGDIVGGVRISPHAPAVVKPVVTPSDPKLWDRAKKAYLRNGNCDAIKENAELSEEHEALLVKEVASEA